MKTKLFLILILLLYPTLSGATIVQYTENFNSYDFGNINGQGNWITTLGTSSTGLLVAPYTGFWNSLQLDNALSDVASWYFNASSNYVYVELTYMPETFVTSQLQIGVYESGGTGFDITINGNEVQNHNADKLCDLNTSYNKIYLEGNSETHDVRIKCNIDTNWNTATFTWDGAPYAQGFDKITFNGSWQGNPEAGDFNVYFDDIYILTSSSTYSYYSGCGEYSTQETCESAGCYWAVMGTATTTGGTIYTNACISYPDRLNWELTDMGIIYGTTATSFVPTIDYNKSSFYQIFSDRVPFAYIFAVIDGVSFLMSENNNASMTSIALTIPDVYGTGTWATTAIMTSFELPILDQEWIFRIIPEDTWATIRAFLSATIWIALFFGLARLWKTVTSIND